MVKPVGEIASEQRLLRLRHVGSGSLSAFIANSSASRLSMLKLMAAQALVLEKPERHTIVGGIELDLNEYIFDVEAECDMEILDIISKSNDSTKSKISKTSILIYKETETAKFGCVEIPTYRRFNTTNGFRMVPTSEYFNLAPGRFITKGTILATSDNSMAGEYSPGKKANVAFCTLPEVGEDSFLVNEEWAKATGYITYLTIELEIPDDSYLLNLFGDERYYKPLMSPGDKVPDDGIVLATRKFTSNDAPVSLDMRRKAIVNLSTDSVKQLSFTGEQYIESVEVVTSHRTKRTGQDYLSYLINEDLGYYSKILSVYKRIKGQVQGQPVLSEYLAQIVEKAIMLADKNVSSDYETKGVKIGKKSRPLPYNTVKLTVRQHHNLKIGGKLTSLYATKGVTVRMVAPEYMPTAKDGTVADIAVDTRTLSDRLVTGVSYEQYFNQTAEDINKEIRSKLSMDMTELDLDTVIDYVRELRLNNTKVFNSIDKIMHDYYSIITPSFLKYFSSANIGEKDEFIGEALKYGISLLMPVDDLSLDPAIDRVKRIEKSKYKPLRDKVYVYDYAKGKKVLTSNPIRIAPLYILILNKTGAEVSASNSVSLNIFNLTGIKNMKHKHSKPFSSSNVVLLGSMESVMVADVVSPKTYAELLDVNSNASSMAFHANKILEDDKPIAMEEMVDRSVINLGTSKTHQLLEHMLGSAGISLQLDGTKSHK